MLKDVYKGIYINLKRSIKRDEYIRQELKNAKLLEYFTRFEAIDGDNFSTTIGDSKLNIYKKACYASHLQALKESLKYNKHIHIIEDDISIHPKTKSILHQLLINNKSPNWDIIFTGINIPISEEYYAQIDNIMGDNSVFKFIDLTKLNIFAGAYSFLINKNSLEKVIYLLEQNRFNKAIDFTLRRLILDNEIKGYTTMPFITLPRSDAFDTTIKNRSGKGSKKYLTNRHFYLSLKVFLKDVDIKEVYLEIIEHMNEQGFSIEPSKKNITRKNVFELLLKSVTIVGLDIL